MYSSIAVNILTLCNQISRTFSSCKSKTLYPLNNQSPFPSPPFHRLLNLYYFLLTILFFTISPTSRPLWPFFRHCSWPQYNCLIVLESSLFSFQKQKTKNKHFFPWWIFLFQGRLRGSWHPCWCVKWSSLEEKRASVGAQWSQVSSTALWLLISNRYYSKSRT